MIKILCKKPNFLIIITTVFAGFEYFFMGIYSYVPASDTLGYFVPREVIFAQHIKESKSIEYFPEIAMGIDGKLPSLEPWYWYHLLYLIFSPSLATVIFYAITFFLSAGSFFYLLKNRLGYAFLPSSIGMFSYMTLILEYANVPWILPSFFALPLSIYFLMKILKLSNYIKKFSLLLICSLFILVTCPFLVTLPYVFLAIVFFFWIANYFSIWLLIDFLIIGLPLIFLNIPFFHATSYAAAYSPRAANIQATSVIQYFQNLWEYFKNYIFFLIPSAVLLCSPQYKEVHRNRYIYWSTMMLIFFSIVIFAEPQRYGIIRNILGNIAGVSLSRAIIIFPFFASLLLSAVLDYLFYQKESQYEINQINPNFLLFKKIFIISACCFFIVLQINIKSHNLLNWMRGANYSWLRNPDLINLKVSDTSIYRVMTITDSELNFRSGIAQIYGFETVDGQTALQSVNYYNLIDDLYYGSCWENGDGGELMPKGYNMASCFKNELEKIDIHDQLNLELLGLSNVKYLISASPLLYSNNELKLLNPSSLEFSTSTLNTGQSKLLEKIKSKLKVVFGYPQMYIYKNLYYQDRFYLDDHINKIPDKRITVNSYYPEKIELSTQTTSSQKLYISIIHSPDWHVMVDAKEVPVFLANDFFSMINLPSGQHKIELLYKKNK